ncbi:MAG: 3'(2'),5'-bisphosphate nucleotidase CysQ [Pseudomonadota bacterium]
MQEPDAGAVLALLEDTVSEAGEIALRSFQANPKTWDKGGGAGPVTEADLAVNAHLRDVLMGSYSDFGWLSEENEDSAERRDARHLFIVDPIDGTRSFIEGSRTWAISVGYAIDGQMAAGIVHLPARALTYKALRGKGATKNGAPIQARTTTAPDGASVLSAKVNFRDAAWDRVPPKPEISFRSSLAYRLALIAEGRFDAMLTLRNTWEWDVAAGSLLVTEAGGAVASLDGPDPRFNTERAALPGLMAGAPGLISNYLAHGPRLAG